MKDSIAAAHKRFLTTVADAYLFHLMSIHRRTVYRHQYGDISLDQASLRVFIDDYLSGKGWGLQKRYEWYAAILDMDAMESRKNTDFIDWGSAPILTRRGIRWLNACMLRLGEMVNAHGGADMFEERMIVANGN